jgi:hypothetical protein
MRLISLLQTTRTKEKFMRSLLTFLVLALTSSAAFSAVQIPPWGMTCEAQGYDIFILPNNKQNQIEVEIRNKQGRLLDDNIYSAIFNRPFVYGDRVSNVQIAIVGLRESQLSHTVVYYQNRFLSKQIKFANCDVN